MDDNFFAYLDKLEILTFFCGYPLIYAIIVVIAGNHPSKPGIRNKLPSLLPYAYALVGILYLGLQLKNLYPDYSVENIRRSFQQPYLKAWGLLAILFWIPAISRKKIISLLHSLVFFFLLIKDLFYQQFEAPSFDINVVKNNMKIYTASLILNLVAFALVALLYSLSSYYKKRHERL
jgi:hypothetical protein